MNMKKSCLSLILFSSLFFNNFTFSMNDYSQNSNSRSVCANCKNEMSDKTNIKECHSCNEKYCCLQCRNKNWFTIQSKSCNKKRDKNRNNYYVKCDDCKNKIKKTDNNIEYIIFKSAKCSNEKSGFLSMKNALLMSLSEN